MHHTLKTAQRFAFNLPPPTVPLAHIPNYFHFNSLDLLHDLLQKPNRFFLEIGPRWCLECSLARLQESSPDLALSLTTKTAYMDGLPIVLTSILHSRFGLSSEKSMDVRTCLQEALINAVVHGNLHMEQKLQSLADFESYYLAVEQRLQTELHPQRIHIMVWRKESAIRLAITDEGSGFSCPDAPVDGSSPDRFVGRGLYIIQSLAEKVWVGHDSRTLNMTFTL